MKFTNPEQFYRGFNIDYNNKNIEALTNEHAEYPLMEIWRKAFASYPRVNMCLSGGIDSQFVLSMLSKLEKEITVYIFSFVWEDCVFNAPDVLHAIRYCDRFGHTYKNIEIDCKPFFDGTESVEYCKKYMTVSPQIALQLKMMDYIENDDPIFLGGDVPFLDFNFSKKRANFIGISYQPFMTHAFLNYGIINNKIVVKDLLRICPDAHAVSYNEFIKTTKQHKLICPAEGNVQTQPLRVLYYRDLGADIITPLLKNTGFENLKLHLAKKTGIYNQYDIKYRHPLAQLLANESWSQQSPLSNKYNLILNNHLIKIKDEYEEFCKTTPDIKPIELYNFDL